MKNRQSSLSSIASMLCFLALTFITLPVYALSTSATTVSTDQSYTITYSGSGFTTLQEKVGNGSWQWVSGDSDSKTFTGKAPNTYYYRTHSRVSCLPPSRFGRWNCPYPYSKPISVTVYAGNPPTLDTQDEQEQYQFETRVGDINRDGLKDIFIRRLSGDLNNGVISQTLLQQKADRNFEVLMPTNGQLAAAQAWSKANIATVLSDFNLDGYVDVFLKDLSSTINGVKDQLVFSSGVPYNGRAQTVTDIDNDFKATFSSAANWVVDKDFFLKNVKIVFRWRLVWRYSCNFSWRYERYVCGWYASYVPVIYIQFNPEIISWNGIHLANAINTIFKEGIDKATYDKINNLASYLANGLGVEISIGSESEDCADAGFARHQYAVAAEAALYCVSVLGRILGTINRAAAISEAFEDQGEVIYRVFGGKASMEGKSWTPVNPIGYPEYRNAAGLPESNTCTHLVMGIVKQANRAFYKIKAADPINTGIYSVKGGLIEYEFRVTPVRSLGIIEYGRVLPMTPPC